jgi:hypothetical protein
MRFPRVERGQHLGKRLLFGVIRLFSGHRAPDVVRTLHYRRDFFGQQWSVLGQEVLRGPSVWTIGERELFAAFVSSINQCHF